MNPNYYISRKRAIKRIAEQINTTLLLWLDENPQAKHYKINGQGKLPPLYQIMAYQGQAILQQRFFGDLRKRIGMEVSHQQWLQFYEQYVEQSGHIQDFISRTHWFKLLNQASPLPEIDSVYSKQFYFILLALLQERSPELLVVAVDHLFLHFWKQQFPESGQTTVSLDSSQLKHKLRSRLSRHFSLACEVKESFTQQENLTNFKLLYRTAPSTPWKVLIELERPRLKTARITAYQMLLEDGELERILDDHPKKQPRRVVVQNILVG